MARARKPKRTQVRVLPRTTGVPWMVTITGAAIDKFDTYWLRKRDAVSYAVDRAKNNEPSQLRIHAKDGTIIEERTYPRSSDPRRTKG